MCADRDIEQAADQAAEYVRITRRPLDGTARGPLRWDDVADAVWADHLTDPFAEPGDLDEFNEQEVPD